MHGLQDPKFTIRFLQTVQKYPILYDPKLKGRTYEIKHWIKCANKAWDEIANKLNCDPIALKKKWKNYRTIATRKLRLEQLGRKVPPYYLHEHIEFLTPYLRTTLGPASSIKQTKNEESEEEKADVHNVDMDDMDNQYESDLEEDVNESEDQDPIYFDQDKDDIALGQEKRSNTASTSTGNAESEQSATIENAKKQFLDSLLPDLNLMSHSQMRQFKYKVLELIDDVLEGADT